MLKTSLALMLMTAPAMAGQWCFDGGEGGFMTAQSIPNDGIVVELQSAYWLCKPDSTKAESECVSWWPYERKPVLEHHNIRFDGPDFVFRGDRFTPCND